MYNVWLCQKICDVLHYLLDNILIAFSSNCYIQIVGISIGTNYDLLVADFVLFCYERLHVVTFWECQDLCYWGVQLYFKIIRWLNEYWQSIFWTNGKSDTSHRTFSSTRQILLLLRTRFLDSGLYIVNGIFSYKINDERIDFNFEIVNFPFLMAMFPASLLIMYIFRSLFVLQEYALM